MPISSNCQKIDKDWTFQIGDFSGAESRTFDDAHWRKLDLPHDWSIEGKFSKDNYLEGYWEDGQWIPRSDSYLPKGIGWYRKRLNVPIASHAQQTYIEFEGVFRNSTLWVNGHEVGTHPSGYTGVVYNVTPYLLADGEQNMLALRVDASKTEGWWYEGSGIYRHVWGITKPALHMVPWHITVTTPKVCYSAATVNVRTRVLNSSGAATCCTVRTTLLDPRGNSVAEMESTTPLATGQHKDVIQEATLNAPGLWSPAHPNLYTVRSKVVAENGEMDCQETTFGIRWFKFTADQGFFLNGQKLQLRGGCIHHDFGGLGTALPDRAHAVNVEVLKEMGANTIRSSHNPAAPALMDACDELGMLVWAETRSLNVDHGAEEELRDLILRDRNHPSIILWSLANTAGDTEGERSTGFLKTLNDLAHQLDPSRPTAIAVEGNADANANHFADVTDVVGYNGGGIGIDDRDHLMFPTRKMLISEFSSGRGARGVYQESTTENTVLETFGDGRIMKRAGHYCSTYDLCLSHEKGSVHFAEGWAHINERPWLAGGLMWSAIEYRGETTGWPIVTSQFGVLDICRFPKDAYYYYQHLWTDTPVFHVFPHWTWPGREGQLIDVWCYRNCCDIVDLFVNGKKMSGEPDYIQYKANRPHLIWRIPYEPGTLIAEGRSLGKVVCYQEIKTAGTAETLQLRPDRTTLAADGEDIALIKISAHDAEGTPVPYANNEIHVEVSAGGKLIGLSSGDPGSHESEKTTHIKLFSGLALAIVQNTGEQAEVVVRVSSPRLKSAETVISVC